MNRQNLTPILIDSRETANPSFLGFMELSTDEQIAKKIYEATGDKTFKGFLPLTWNTAQIVKMRDIYDTLKKQGKLTALNMAYKYPEVSIQAHQYFITNAAKIKGIVPDTPQDFLKMFTPFLVVGGIAAAAYLLSQVKGFIPKGKTHEQRH
jgi:hypothetical protein